MLAELTPMACARARDVVPKLPVPDSDKLMAWERLHHGLGNRT